MHPALTSVLPIADVFDVSTYLCLAAFQDECKNG
jgi:hypothetical protein